MRLVGRGTGAIPGQRRMCSGGRVSGFEIVSGFRSLGLRVETLVTKSHDLTHHEKLTTFFSNTNDIPEGS